MNDKKAAKKLIKQFKKHPDLYSKGDVLFAKLIKQRIKWLEKNESSESSKRDSKGGGNDGLRGESQQPEQPRQSKRQWIAKVLHKAWSLVSLRASTHVSGNRNHKGSSSTDTKA